jgi:hypothetical protein
MERQTESDFPTEDYEAHQTAQDADYAAEYRRWVASLSESDRQRLTLDGILEPDCSIRATSCGSGSGEIDIALISGWAGRENGERVPTIDAILPTDTDQDQLRALGLSEEQAEAVLEWETARNADAINDLAADRLARFFVLLMPSNSKTKINLSLLGARALAGGFLMNRSGTTTLSDLAQRAGMSKQLLDFHTRRMEDALDFHGFAQKGVHTREVYSQAAKERWSTLTPAERRARRRGQSGIVGTQHETHNAQRVNLTGSTGVE